MKSKNKLEGSLFLVLATLSHGLYGIFSRIIGIGFGQIFQIVARSTILLIFFVIATKMQHKWKKIAVADYKWFLLMIIPGLIALASMFTAFNYLPLGTVLFTYYAVSTLSSYLLGSLLFKEKLDVVKLISLVLCFIGLYLTYSGSIKTGNILYLSLACLAGLGAAAWNIVSKKISDKYPTTEILVMDNLLMIIVGLPIALLLKEPVSLPSFTLPWFGILGYSIAAIGSSIFTIKGFKLLQAQIGSLIMLLEPVFGAFIGWLVYRETLSIFAVFGAMLILFGAALPNIKSLSEATQSPNK